MSRFNFPLALIGVAGTVLAASGGDCAYAAAGRTTRPAARRGAS
jgi:hypothetical protein